MIASALSLFAVSSAAAAAQLTGGNPTPPSAPVVRPVTAHLPGLDPQPQPRIIGGHQVVADAQTPAVALYDQGQFICTAVLIAPDSVATGGHCASRLPTSDAEIGAPPVARDALTIRAGSRDRTAGEARQVTQVGLHRDWNWAEQTGAGDIAVLHLDTPIRDVTPARVGSPHGDQPVTMLGWGLEIPPLDLGLLLPPDLAEQLPDLPLPRPDAPRMLNTVDLWLVDPAQCPPVEPALGPAENCLAATPPADTCNGDSGGPGMQDGEVVALVSRGTTALLPCGLSHTVTTDPGDYRQWIEDTIAQQRAAA